jgi:hypothetical protein
METPSEWAKRFNRQKSENEVGLSNAQAVPVDAPASVADFPSEPFPCPACGQLLAPSCRVCVACRHTIDPAEIVRPREVVLPGASMPGAVPKPELVRYPWPIFFAVLGISFLLALLLEGSLGEQKAQLAMGGVQTLAGVWVFFDALRQRVPRPLRWAIGSMLLPVVVFPWYLARRNKPTSSVPFVEAQVGPVTRFVLFALLFFILASLIFYLVEGPQPATAPASPPKLQTPNGNSPSRITDLHLREEGGWKRGADEGSRPLLGPPSVQAETSAPSDAWQT